MACSSCDAPTNQIQKQNLDRMSKAKRKNLKFLPFPLPLSFSLAFKLSGMLPDFSNRVSRSTSCKDVAFLIASRILCISSGFDVDAALKFK